MYHRFIRHCITICITAFPLLPIIPGASFSKQGVLEIEKMKIRLIAADAGGKFNAQDGTTVVIEKGYPKTNGTSFTLKGTYTLRSGEKFSFTQSAERMGDEEIMLSYTLTGNGSVKVTQLAVGCQIPAAAVAGKDAKIDGESIPFPEAKGPQALASKKAARVSIHGVRGTMTCSGAWEILLQDSRQWGNMFELRLFATPSQGVLGEATVRAAITYRPDAGAHVGPVTIVPSDEWQPIPMKPDIAPGSVLDASALADAPAGKYGPMMIKDGRFVFEKRPNEQAKLYGCNLCFDANYLEKKDAENFADLMVRMGYNAVRFHHHDRSDRGLIDKNAATSLVFDEAMLDKLDYLFFCLKKRGVYSTTDTYVSRLPKPNEIPGVTIKTMEEFKALITIHPDAFENWKTYTRMFLTHVNPYTGKAWKDDEALVTLSLINEGNLTGVWDASAATRRMFEDAFADWIKDKRPPKDKAERESLFQTFLYERHSITFAAMKSFIRSLGCSIPLSDVNHVDLPSLLPYRAELDFVENHGYWDHPQFLEQPWRKPFSFGNTSSVPGFAALPRTKMYSRIIGKPYIITEYQYTFPNQCRAEGALLMPAYAALQGWDAVYRFTFANARANIISNMMANGFNIAVDPITFLSETAGAYLYRRDIRPASSMIPLAVTKEIRGYTAKADLDQFTRLGLWAKVGAAVDSESTSSFSVVLQSNLMTSPRVFFSDASLIESLRNAGHIPTDIGEKTVRSETGELFLDAAAGIAAAQTEQSEVFVLPNGKRFSGAFLDAESIAGFALAAAVSVDGKAITESARILLLHLTDVKNSGTRFRDPEMTVLEDDGALPLLMKRGVMRFSLATAKPLRLWGCDISGRRVEELPIARTEGKIVFLAETVKDGKARYFVYELARQ